MNSVGDINVGDNLSEVNESVEGNAGDSVIHSVYYTREWNNYEQKFY